MAKEQQKLIISVSGGLGRIIAMTGAITEVAKTRDVEVITGDVVNNNNHLSAAQTRA